MLASRFTRQSPTRIDKLTFEMAQLKLGKVDQKPEQFNAEQKALFDEAVDADIAALAASRASSQSR